MAPTVAFPIHESEFFLHLAYYNLLVQFYFLCIYAFMRLVFVGFHCCNLFGALRTRTTFGILNYTLAILVTNVLHGFSSVEE
jgi:hypothetical protein